MSRGTRERPIISPHARARIKEMGLTDHRVAAVLTDPEIEYEQTDHAPAARLAQRGVIAVAFVDDGALGIVVTTVMPRTQALYTRKSPKEGSCQPTTNGRR